MSFALITDGGADGRYTIFLDYGEAHKEALLEQVTLAQIDISAKIIVQQGIIATVDAAEAASLANLQVFQDALIAEMAVDGEGPDDAALELYTDVLNEHRKLLIQNQPIRDALRTLETKLAQANAKAAYWNSTSVTSTRQAWCCDFTEDATGYVATVEIPGEPSLVLIAPGGRAWQGGDGTIATAKKNAALALLNGRLVIAEAERDTKATALATATAEEVTLRTAATSAQTAYSNAIASGDQDVIVSTGAAFEAAAAALNEKRRQIADLQLALQILVARIASLNQQISVWSAKAASDDPVYGDGSLLARELMSPEQVYFNAAILPGWQRDLPTYRWATVTSINFDDDKIDVTIGNATSSAQSLNVNKFSSLSSVPVEYADDDSECNCRAFGTGDRVVVELIGLDWADPKIIGYLDNPRPCPPKFTGTITSKTFYVGSGDVSLVANFIGGAETRTFSIIEGTLPPGVSLGASTGILSYSGRAYDEITENVKVRCSDAFFVSGTNRRYDESNTFAVTVQPAWTDVEGSANGVGISFFPGPVGVSRVQFTFTGGEGRANFTGGGSTRATPRN